MKRRDFLSTLSAGVAAIIIPGSQIIEEIITEHVETKMLDDAIAFKLHKNWSMTFTSQDRDPLTNFSPWESFDLGIREATITVSLDRSDCEQYKDIIENGKRITIDLCAPNEPICYSGEFTLKSWDEEIVPRILEDDLELIRATFLSSGRVKVLDNETYVKELMKVNFSKHLNSNR